MTTTWPNAPRACLFLAAALLLLPPSAGAQPARNVGIVPVGWYDDRVRAWHRARSTFLSSGGGPSALSRANGPLHLMNYLPIATA